MVSACHRVEKLLVEWNVEKAMTRTKDHQLKLKFRGKYRTTTTIDFVKPPDQVKAFIVNISMT